MLVRYLPDTPIGVLAHVLLDQKELALADHLTVLLADDKYDPGALIMSMIPMYWEEVGDRARTLKPDGIYRPLYYVHQYRSLREFENKTRVFLNNVCGHLEGCLLQLTATPPQFRTSTRPFGGLVRQLRDSGVLPDELALSLFKFNEAVNVPSKHFGAYTPTDWLDERTFSIEEASLSFMMMRKMSIELFRLLKARGISLAFDWPPFNEEWLEWSPLFEERPKS